MRIYIASSWKNQHAVEMLTEKLRAKGFKVLSWVENNYGENPNSSSAERSKKFDFDEWVSSPESDQSFEYDTHGAGTCDLFIYLGPAGKDAAAECGICYGQRFNGRTIPMYGLWAKSEDFGLMRKMFDAWFERYTELLEAIENHFHRKRSCRVCGCTDDNCSQCIAKTGYACHWVECDLCSACVSVEDVEIEN